MTDLFLRLEAAEAAERRRVETLRAQLSEAEARLTKLAITRETLLSLEADDPDEHPQDKEGESSAERPVLNGRVHPVAEPEVPTPRRALSDYNRQVVVLLASAGRVMRSREVAEALSEGEPVAHNRVEVMRTRLKRLVSTGWLLEPEPGLFLIAAGVNGYAGAGAAETNS